MKRLACLTLGLFLALAALPSRSAAKTKVELKDGQGKAVGEIVVWDQGPGVALELKLHDLTPGEHAIHFHAVPKCEGPDFKSAGGHFNPEGKKHGFDSPDGHHAGDMKNFTVGADGKAKVEAGRRRGHAERRPALAAHAMARRSWSTPKRTTTRRTRRAIQATAWPAA